MLILWRTSTLLDRPRYFDPLCCLASAAYTDFMRRLAEWTITHRNEERRIELYWGDLSMLPPQHAVDILVVSAFPGDYMPTPTSLIGALYRNGISVGRLALTKQKDMREEFSCWMSEPVVGASGFKRILCIESGWRGSPPEITDDIFRALAPCSISEFPNGSVAMPLIGAGDQGYPVDEIMKSILRAAVFWFNRGLNLRLLKIVAYSEDTAALAQKAFLEAKQSGSLPLDRPVQRFAGAPAPVGGQTDSFDVFLSYAHEDAAAAKAVVKLIESYSPGVRVFFDREVLAPGASWVLKIADSLDASRFVTPLYSPTYWKKKYCKDEFAAAYLRQNDTGRSILFPLYFQTTDIPSLFRTIQFTDCREADESKLAGACRELCKALN